MSTTTAGRTTAQTGSTALNPAASTSIIRRALVATALVGFTINRTIGMGS